MLRRPNRKFCVYSFVVASPQHHLTSQKKLYYFLICLGRWDKTTNNNNHLTLGSPKGCGISTYPNLNSQVQIGASFKGQIVINKETTRYRGSTHVHLQLRATSHTSQEPWPWNCESWNESVQRPSQHASKIMQCGHGCSSVVWSHMQLGPRSNAISMNFYSCGSSHMINYNKLVVVSVWSAMVSRFCVRSTS